MEHELECFEEMKVIHYPSLKTVLMVESLIEKKGSFKNKRQMWKALPNSVMYQTFLMILAYLEHSNKIIIDKTGEIVWIWHPEFVDRILKSGVRIL